MVERKIDNSNSCYSGTTYVRLGLRPAQLQFCKTILCHYGDANLILPRFINSGTALRDYRVSETAKFQILIHEGKCYISSCSLRLEELSCKCHKSNTAIWTWWMYSRDIRHRELVQKLHWNFNKSKLKNTTARWIIDSPSLFFPEQNL